MTHITPERITELFKQAFDETRQGDSMAQRFAALLFAEAAPIPDAITDNSESPEYKAGWNECRELTIQMRKK
jgi:hypothetical protein